MSAALAATDGIPLSLRNGLSTQITFIRAKNGPRIFARDLRCIPGRLLGKLIQAATDFLSENEHRNFISERSSLRNVCFDIGERVSAEDERGRREFSQGTLHQEYERQISRIDHYMRRARIGPYAHLPPEQIPPGHAANETLIHTDTSYIDYVHPVVSYGSTGLFLTSSALLSLSRISRPLLISLCQSSIPLYGLSSGFILYRAYNDYQAAKAIGDMEGAKEAKRTAVEGAVLALGTLPWGASEILLETGSSASHLIAGLTYASAVFYGAGYLAGTIVSAYGMSRCIRFRNRLNSFLKNYALPEIQRIKGALHFLKDQLAITPQELQEMAASLSPGTSIQEKISHVLQTKIARLGRRIGEKALREVMQKLEGILQRLDSPQAQASALQEADALIALIKSENRKKIFTQCVMMIIGLIGLLATIATSVSSFGALPLLLIAISCVLSAYGSYKCLHRWMGRDEA